MSGDERKRHELAETLTLAAAGWMSGGVAAELTKPLRDIREGLAAVVDQLDQHLLGAQGPSPYPWDATKALRERSAQLYLESRRVARLTSDLANAINTFGKSAEVVDVNQLVEVAVNLSRHRMASSTELFIDFGRVPSTRLVPGSLILVLTRLMMICADSANEVLGAAVSVKTRSEGEGMSIYVADSGMGRQEDTRTAVIVGQDVADSLNGRFEGRYEKGKGSVFELWIPAEP